MILKSNGWVTFIGFPHLILTVDNNNCILKHFHFAKLSIYCCSNISNSRGYMVFNATFNNISVISWSQCYWWMKPEYPEKTINLPQDISNGNGHKSYQHYKHPLPTMYLYNIINTLCLQCTVYNVPLQHYRHPLSTMYLLQCTFTALYTPSAYNVPFTIYLYNIIDTLCLQCTFTTL